MCLMSSRIDFYFTNALIAAGSIRTVGKLRLRLIRAEQDCLLEVLT